MKINVLTNFDDIVHKALNEQDVRCLDFINNEMHPVKILEIRELVYHFRSNNCIFVEVINEN